MQHDEVIWQVINQGFCSYKVKTPTANFCKNKYNVTGLCNRSSCPLANSRYATVLEEKGTIYLYIKTIERAHLPSKLWEKVKLSTNYSQALAQITEQLQFWPNFNVHKCKQRLTKIHQYLIRMRKLKLKMQKVKLVGAPKKVERREATREKKAEKAGRIEDSIRKELLQRLEQGVYKDGIYLPEKEYSQVLDLVGEEDEIEEDEEEEEGEEENEMELEDGEQEGDEEDDIEDDTEFVADFEDSDDEANLEDIAMSLRGDDMDEGDEMFGQAGPDEEEEGTPTSSRRTTRGGAGRKRGADADDEDNEPPSKKSKPAPAAAAASSSAKKKAPVAKRPTRRGPVQIEYEQEHEVERESSR